MSVATPSCPHSIQMLNFPENGREGQIRRCWELEEVVTGNVNEGSSMENGS